MYNSYFFHCNLGVVLFYTTKKRQLNHQLCDNWQMFVFLREVEHRIGNGLGQYGPYVFLFAQTFTCSQCSINEHLDMSIFSCQRLVFMLIFSSICLTSSHLPTNEHLDIYIYIQPLSCDLSNIICYADPTLSWSPAMIILPTNACLVGAKPLS